MIGGRILGAFFGLFLGGPIGAIIGFWLGYHFDRGLDMNLNTPPPHSEEPPPTPGAQQLFFQVCFEMMGYLAKSDGRVNEQEIQAARQIMHRLGLTPHQRQSAIAAFTAGKAAHYPWKERLQAFHSVYRYRWPIRQMFLEILLEAAYADGAIHPTERHLLDAIALRLGFSKGRLREIEERLMAEQNFQGFFRDQQQQQWGRQQGRYQEPPRQAASKDVLSEAYALLGAKASDSDAQVKRAYRKRMSEHHPDKLMAKGLPPDMIRLATEKSQMVQDAYETICRQRERA